MIKIFCVSLLTLLSMHAAAQRQDNASILDVDYENLVSRASLTYDKPVSRSEEGMPVGNGRMGSLVWTTPSALHFQLNRVDVFANNSGSNNFYERHTDYCNGVGFVDVDFLTGDIFTGRNFRQQLSCYEGLVTTQGKGVKTNVLAWHAQDVMALQVEDNRAHANITHINLRTLRSPVAKNGNHQALSTLKIVGNRIVLLQEFREDSFYCASSVVLDVVGARAQAMQVNETTVRLSIDPGNARFSVMMASAASFDPREDVLALSMNRLDRANALGFEGLLQSNKVWWEQFWKRSFIRLHSQDGQADLVEKYYTYYLYVMASSSRGAYPTKFNGMLWTTGGDARKWGNLYWGANQSCLYNALFPTNRMELMDPMFNMYSSMRDACAVAAKQQWGSHGIFIPETVAFDGLVALPPAIAEEIRALYLLKKPWEERSQQFRDYAFTKMPFLSRWNWKKDGGWKAGRWHVTDKGGGPFGHVTHIFSRGAKIAYQYWLKYEYTQDREWLRNEAYPMLKGVAEFYRNFPHLKKGDDGKYHIHHINDNESIWGGHNTIEEIASMMGIFPVAIKAADLLKVDANLREAWKEVLDNLSPLPVSTDYPESTSFQDVTWVRALPPVVQGDGSRVPDPNTLPVWFFDLCTLESDAATSKIANATFDAYFPDGIDTNTSIYVLSKLPIAGSLLGRESATQYLIPNQLETAEIEVMPNRMDLREGFQTTSVQRIGRAAEALHYALCQSVPPGPGKEPVIRVFPAWPKAWDAQFLLLCRGAFLVTASRKNAKTEFVEIVSQAGSDCRIRNPWPGDAITLYRNNKKWKDLTGDLLVFQTNKHDRFVLVRKGDVPDALRRSVSVKGK